MNIQFLSFSLDKSFNLEEKVFDCSTPQPSAIELPIIKNLLMQQINVSDKKRKKLELTMKNLTDVIELNENMESNLEELFSEIDKIGISEFLSKWKKNN